jgi:hypothetical protein
MVFRQDGTVVAYLIKAASLAERPGAMTTLPRALLSLARAARERFGNFQTVGERCRQARGAIMNMVKGPTA